jgi:RNase P/RNase MRP subunit POP5
LIWTAVYQLFGEYGASKVNLALIDYDPLVNFAIIRCSHVSIDIVRAAIVSITKVNGNSIAIHVRRVSGTLKSIQQLLEKQRDL